ncbi:hypothetical protein GWI33_004623 [Rhynchophorus ferrugineus]|uniref:Uncharacterized protein n=1 Tax=Rhynchophorus ferrugineus TaxID=354439 RepID=A0A834IZ28_RHYFE|nr:hypothetical protein GWI33_004623 [Rhynchophorus ferrugineus]
MATSVWSCSDVDSCRMLYYWNQAGEQLIHVSRPLAPNSHQPPWRVLINSRERRYSDIKAKGLKILRRAALYSFCMVMAKHFNSSPLRIVAPRTNGVIFQDRGGNTNRPPPHSGSLPAPPPGSLLKMAFVSVLY